MNANTAAQLRSLELDAHPHFSALPRNPVSYARHLEREIRKFIARRDEALADPPDDDRILCCISEPEILTALDRADAAIVEAATLAVMAQVAKRRASLQTDLVMQLVREQEEIDPVAQWSIDYVRRLVCKPQDEDPSEAARATAIIGIFRQLSKLDAGALKGVRNGVVPEAWQAGLDAVGGAAELVRQVAEFLVDHGQRGAAFVGNILTDADWAAQAAADDDLDDPLRKLAIIVAKFGPVAADEEA